MTEWFRGHPFLTFAVLYFGLAFVYVKVFRERKLPVLKEAVIYLLMAVGAMILWLMQLDLRMPVVQCMLAALSLMAVVRLRIVYLERSRRSGQQGG